MSFKISTLKKAIPKNHIVLSCSVDAEHPKIIPMDAPTPPTTPLGPMTQARAKAIKDKVNSLLSELPLSMHETWLLPKSEMLCMIRYQEGPPEDAHEDGQVPKSIDVENQRKEPGASPRPRTSGPWSAFLYSCSTTKCLQAPDIRPRKPGHPALPKVPDIRPPARKSEPHRTREQHGQLHQPGHPARRPDVQPPCLRTVKGRGPCTPSTP